jgi:membrane fusion protein (multidrug efflux system)
MKLRLVLQLLLLVTGLAAGGLLLYRHFVPDQAGAATAEEQKGGAPQGPMATPVVAGKVRIGEVEGTLSAVGSLRSEESVTVSSEIAGRVKEILVAEGQRVSKGAVLVLLDASIYEAQLAQAEARQDLNQANMKRAETLRSRGNGTDLAVDEATANLRTDKAAATLAEAWIDKMRILAPFEGVLGLRQVSVGEYVEPGEAMFNLEAIDRLKVDFRVPEVYLSKVATDQKIEISTDALPGQTFPGTVYAIDPKVDPAGRSIVIRALVPNQDGKLRPGLFTRVELIVEHRQSAILVPEQALVPQGNDEYVYRVVDGKAKLTRVDVGERRAGEAEILEGLSPEDVVVFEGQIKIGDGAPVTVVPPQGQGQGQS